MGEPEFIRLAKRGRKRVGGGMRQVGVVVAMGSYALHHNVKRLEEDHLRAKRFAEELHRNGFRQPQEGNVDTNIVYFGLPEDTLIEKEKLQSKLLDEYGVKLSGGYIIPYGDRYTHACTLLYFYLSFIRSSRTRSISAFL